MCALLGSDYCAELNCVSQKKSFLEEYIFYDNKNKNLTYQHNERGVFNLANTQLLPKPYLYE